MMKTTKIFLLFLILNILSNIQIFSQEDNLTQKLDYGTLTKNTYENEFFQFKIKLPKDWVVQSKEQNEELKEISKKMILDENKDLAKYIDAGNIKTIYLLTIFKYELGYPTEFNPSMILLAENLKSVPGIKNGKDYLFHAKKLIKYAQPDAVILTNDFEKVVIDSVDFYKFELLNKSLDLEVKQTFLSTVIKGFSFNVIYTYSNKEEEETLLTSINTMLFNHIKSYYSREEAERFVKQLNDLNYFKYADFDQLDSLKEIFIDQYNPESELPFAIDDYNNLPMDYRYYYCDSETIFEHEGVKNLIEELRQVFRKMNFKCVITNHIEEWDEEKEWLNHSLTINGSNYIIFKNYEDYDWDAAVFRIAEILNIELKKQNIDEQIYLINGGNDCKLAILSKDQYKLIYDTFKDKAWKPLEINEWAKEFNIKPIKY